MLGRKETEETGTRPGADSVLDRVVLILDSVQDQGLQDPGPGLSLQKAGEVGSRPLMGVCNRMEGSGFSEEEGSWGKCSSFGRCG